MLATCNIFGNAHYDVFLKDIGSDISCTGVYWGTAAGSEIDAHIHDFYDVSALGEVLYTPYVPSPIGVPFEQNVVSSGKYLFGEAEMAFTSLAGAGTFRVTVYPDTYPPGFPTPDKPIKKKFVIHADPGITSFSGSLTLWYAQEEFNNSDISDENSLYCTYYDGDAWHPCPSTVDVTNNRVTCTASTPGIWGIGGEDGTFPVRLSLFTAQAGDGEVSLHWCTESEVDNVGFDIWRALPEEGQYERITSELIPGVGNTSSLYIYSFSDKNVVNGFTYWYKVEAVASEGTRTRHGPIAATPQAKVELLEQEIISAQPDVYALSACIPNPFNPSATIRYQVSEPGEVSLTIYDVLGQRVRVLVSGRQLAGWYQVSWDGRDEAGRLVSSGVYFYRLEAGTGFVQTRKALLLR